MSGSDSKPFSRFLFSNFTLSIMGGLKLTTAVRKPPEISTKQFKSTNNWSKRKANKHKRLLCY